MKMPTRKNTVRFFCSLAICLGVCPAGMLYAQENLQPVATNEVTKDVQSEEFSSPEMAENQTDTPGPEERQKAIEKRQLIEARIAELEISSSTYSPELSQVYMELGDTLNILGLHDEATAVLDKSFQNTRINKGLNDPGQLVILDTMIEISLKTENWETSDNHMHLYFYLIQQNYESGDDLRVSALLQLAHWKAYAVNAELVTDSRPTEISESFKSEIGLLDSQDDYEGKAFDLARLNLGFAEYQLFLTGQVARKDLKEYRTGESPTQSTRVECYAVRLANGSFTQMCMPIEDPNMDYYLMPSHARNLEMQRHLDGMRASLASAYTELEKQQDSSDEFNQLLAEVNRLTGAYNDYIDKYLQ